MGKDVEVIRMNSVKNLVSYLGKHQIDVAGAAMDMLAQKDGEQATDKVFSALKNVSDALMKVSINGIRVSNYARWLDVYFFLYWELATYLADKLALLGVDSNGVAVEDLDVEGFVTGISQKISAFPEEVLYIYSIPSVVSEVDKSVAVSESVKLEMFSSIYSREGRTLLDALRDSGSGYLSKFSPSRDCLCLVFTIKGIGTRYESALMSEAAFSIFKQLFMTLYILEMVSVEQYAKVHADNINVDIMGFRSFGDGGLKRVPLQFSTISALQKSSLSKKGIEILEAINSGVGVESVKELGIIRRMLDSDGDEFRRYRMAVEWLFDAYYSENTATSFIFTSLAIEAYLGDKDSSKNTKEVLASRFAYSISKSPPSREMIYHRYKEFYDKRSKLVHGSPVEMTEHEGGMLAFIQSMFKFLLREVLILQDRNGLDS